VRGTDTNEYDAFTLYFMLGLRRGEILLLLSTVDDISKHHTEKDFKMHGAVQKKE